MTADTTQNAPTDTVEVAINNLQASQQIYLSGSYTKEGIASVTDSSGANPQSVVIHFTSPAILGAGTYRDTVTLKACYSSACTQQIAGSPQTVQVTYTVTASPLTLTSLSPASATAGGPSFTLTATGTDFTSQSALLWNGTQVPTTFVSSTKLTSQIPASDIATTGGVPASVFDVTNGTTSALTFTVKPPVLGLNEVSPTTVTAGGRAFTLTVLGTGFTTSSKVMWNGTALPTTYVAESEVLAQVSAADIAAVGHASVTVEDPTSSVGTTSAQTVTITAPSIDAVGYQMNAAHTGAVNFNSVSFPTSSLWSVTVGGPASYALIVNDRVFVTVSVNGNTELLALNASTGATVWGPIEFPGIANAAYDAGKLFVVSGTGNTTQIISAVDPVTGATEWSANVSGDWFPAPPVATDGEVYAVNGGVLTAFSEADGATLWHQNVGGTFGTVAVTADGVYSSSPCTTYDFRPATGETVWTDNTGCSGGGGNTPVTANGVVYSPINGNYSGESYNAETGALLSGFSTSYIPAVTATTAFMLNSGTLQAESLSNNQILWSFAGDGSLDTAPIEVNNYVIVGSSNGNLYALDASTGAQIWTQNVGAPIATGTNSMLSGLAAGDGLLVVPAGNTVTAYTISSNP